MCVGRQAPNNYRKKNIMYFDAGIHNTWLSSCILLEVIVECRIMLSMMIPFSRLFTTRQHS